jgi:hypothetical protein
LFFLIYAEVKSEIAVGLIYTWDGRKQEIYTKIVGGNPMEDFHLDRMMRHDNIKVEIREVGYLDRGG